jgi:hypothetical protein
MMNASHFQEQTRMETTTTRGRSAILLSSVLATVFVGCSRSHDVESAKSAIRELVPASAGIPNAEWDRIATAEIVPKVENFKSQPLTWGLFIHPILHRVDWPEGVCEARQAEYSVSTGPQYNRVMRAEMVRSMAAGYRTLIQPDRITDITCDISDGRATGVVRFEVPEKYRGAVEYTAKWDNGQWKITEFRMPARSWTFRRVEPDRWEWSDYYGRKSDQDRFKPEHVLTGHAEFNGEPVANARIDFVNLDAPEAFLQHHGLQKRKTDENGDFSSKLPAGRYGFCVECNEPPLRIDYETGEYTYRARDGSTLIVEIKEGKNHLEIDLVPKEATETTERQSDTKP